MIKRDNLFAIYSVYYDENGKIYARSTAPEPAISDDFEYLKTQLPLMLEAADQETIEFETIEKAEEIRTAHL